MPSHVYQPLRNPPGLWERLLVHPMENAVAVLAVYFGALMALALTNTGFTPSRSMGMMPWQLVVIVSGFIGTGGILALVGIHWTGESVSKGWALERLGWLLAAAGYLAYTVAVAWQFPASIVSYSFPAVLSLAAGLRVVSLHRIEKTTRQVVAQVKREAGDAQTQGDGDQ